MMDLKFVEEQRRTGSYKKKKNLFQVSATGHSKIISPSVPSSSNKNIISEEVIWKPFESMLAFII